MQLLGRMLTVKALLASIALTALSLQPLPASAQTPVSVQSGATAVGDLPLTPRFAALLSGYRDCVLREVEETVALGDQREMARDAMSACVLSRWEMRTQLLSDILRSEPAISPAVAAASADSGVDQIEPMIHQAAVDWAHVRYGRIMD